MDFSEKVWYKRVEGCLRIPVGRSHHARIHVASRFTTNRGGARGRKSSRGEPDDDPEPERICFGTIHGLAFPDQSLERRSHRRESSDPAAGESRKRTTEHDPGNASASIHRQYPEHVRRHRITIALLHPSPTSSGVTGGTVPADRSAFLLRLRAVDNAFTPCYDGYGIDKTASHRRGAASRVGRRCERDGSRTRRPKGDVVGGTTGSVRPRQASDPTFPPLSSFG